MQELDAAATALINGFAGRFPLLDGVMIAIAGWGVPVMVLAVASQWWYGADRRGRRHVLIAAGLAFLLGLALNQMVLLEFDRVRPYVDGVTSLIVAPSADPSFPSDHATAAFAIAATFMLGRMRGQAFWFFLAAFVVALSRVFVGIHYIGDILGGAATGAIAAMIVSASYRRDTRMDRVLTGIL
jgi:undecaprenyl-diphosphatase